jgi:hypothetical protein
MSIPIYQSQHSPLITALYGRRKNIKHLNFLKINVNSSPFVDKKNPD